jgi:hypothetical protein
VLLAVLTSGAEVSFDPAKRRLTTAALLKATRRI